MFRSAMLRLIAWVVRYVDHYPDNHRMLVAHLPRGGRTWFGL